MVPVSESIAWPHEEQKRALVETLAPHIGQNMRDGILSPVRGRGVSRNALELNGDFTGGATVRLDLPGKLNHFGVAAYN